MSSIDAFLLGTLRRIVGPLSAKRRREAAAQHALEAAARADLVASGLFDAAYYLAHSPDVAQARMDPAFHYLHHGWREGRQPSAAFDGDFYLGVHADVRAQDVNPLLHYARFG